MHPELEILLEIQDLQMLRRDLADASDVLSGILEPTPEYSRRLEERITERERRLSARVRSTYEKVAKRHERVVAPVLNGVCCGCFVQLPRGERHDAQGNAQLRNCESCGRFVYFPD